MTHHYTSVLAAAFAGVLAGGSVGCNPLDCGQGTIESNGTCIPADEAPDDAVCGDGTELGPDGKCIPSEIVMCDPETTREEINPANGVITCFGTGGDGCSADLPCPPPSSGKITICGRLLDTQTDAPITSADPRGTVCDPANPTADGPCSIKLTFVDALEFSTDPSGATPHIPASFVLDDCGRYVAIDLPLSALSYTGIAVDDATGTTDRHRLTGVALPDAEAVPREDFAAYTTRNETDAAWHTSSGIGGMTFAQRGVVAFIFRHAHLPEADVQILRNNQPIAADDFYFSDASPTARSTIAAGQAVTGANGTGLAIRPGSSGPENYNASGGLPGGCQWPTALAAAIPTVVFVQIKDAETTGGAECP